jgi:hypothetical protein
MPRILTTFPRPEVTKSPPGGEVLPPSARLVAQQAHADAQGDAVNAWLTLRAVSIDEAAPKADRNRVSPRAGAKLR